MNTRWIMAAVAAGALGLLAVPMMLKSAERASGPRGALASVSSEGKSCSGHGRQQREWPIRS